jgi:hypothetical protein
MKAAISSLRGGDWLLLDDLKEHLQRQFSLYLHIEVFFRALMEHSLFILVFLDVADIEVELRFPKWALDKLTASFMRQDAVFISIG